MTKVRGVTGGGIDSKNVAHTNAPKREPINHPVSQGAVSRLGGMVGEGTPFKNLYSSKATTPFGTTPSVAGPGGGRMVMKSGSQGQHGSAVPGTARPGANKPIFPGFK
jgi:hypothetical protein